MIYNGDEKLGNHDASLYNKIYMQKLKPWIGNVHLIANVRVTPIT
jgi:hypothetical protein